VLTAPGSLGATATTNGGVLTISTASSNSDAVEQITVGGMKISADTSAAPGAITTTLGGTLVTAAGPHGGDEEARRLGWPLGDVARIHAVSVDVLVASVVVLVVVLVRVHAPRRTLTTASFTLLAMTAQGVLGYVQYFNEIPAILVGFHVFGAVLVFVAVQELLFSMRAAGASAVTPVVTDSDTSVGIGAHAPG
jgi:cytochrome c oxidase assembly protein subunit 15